MSLDRILLPALSSLGWAGGARPHFLLCSLMVKSLITKLTTLSNCIPHQRKIPFEGLSPHRERDWPNSFAPFCLYLSSPASAWGLGAGSLTFRMLPVAGPTLFCAPSFYKPHWKKAFAVTSSHGSLGLFPILSPPLQCHAVVRSTGFESERRVCSPAPCYEVWVDWLCHSLFFLSSGK